MIKYNNYDKCKFISSRGILSNCTVKSYYPISSNSSLFFYNLNEIKDNSVVYICNTAIRNFSDRLENINARFILVSGDSDDTVYEDLFDSYDDFLKFIESDKIIKWFSQNCTVTHPKIHQIPIGLDYHSDIYKDRKISAVDQENIINEIINNSKPFNERIMKAYCNFHFNMNSYDRKDALANINKNLVYYEPDKIKRFDNYYSQSKFVFVISPHGIGLDCHRTWEALVLGCIPIVKTSGLDSLYDNLPVLILNDWSDLTEELMIDTINKFKNIKFNYEKLTIKYWLSKIFL
jgi:hypothetical protein